MKINISAPVMVYPDTEGHIDSVAFDDNRFDSFSGITGFLSGKNNLGLGIDIGLTYNLSERLMLSAALTDVGYIKWKRDLTSLKVADQVIFNGNSMLDIYNKTMTFDDLGSAFLDSLSNSITVSGLNEPFTTWLPFGVTVGGSYSLTKALSVGLLSNSRFIGKKLKETLTLSGNVNLGNIFSTSLSYTLANNRYDNLGAGLAVRAGVVQFYFLADRIPLKWKTVAFENNHLPFPVTWNTVNLHFGMNLLFGNKRQKKEDKPMVLVE
jgi:hypothetical protein